MKADVEPKNQRDLDREQPAPLVLDLLRRLTSFREFMILAIVITGCVVMWFTTPIFMTFGNWSALLLQVSVECIVAIGMTVLLVSGGFFFFVGSTLSLGGAVTPNALFLGGPPPTSVFPGFGHRAGHRVLYCFFHRPDS